MKHMYKIKKSSQSECHLVLTGYFSGLPPRLPRRPERDPVYWRGGQGQEGSGAGHAHRAHEVHRGWWGFFPLDFFFMSLIFLY